MSFIKLRNSYEAELISLTNCDLRSFLIVRCLNERISEDLQHLQFFLFRMIVLTSLRVGTVVVWTLTGCRSNDGFSRGNATRHPTTARKVIVL